MKNICLIILFLIIPTFVFAFQQVEFQAEFGQEGSGPGQLNEPSDIAVDPGGKIYVADKANKRIQVLSQDGKMVNEWSSRKGYKWTMESPSGIALYGDRVYITDSSLDKVLIFTKDGEFIDEFGSSGSDPKQFDEPEGIFVYQGIIYVADAGNHRLQTFSLDGIYLRSIGVKGNAAGQMRRPTDVAVDHKGDIYVTDEDNKRVQVFDSAGRNYKNYVDVSGPSSIAMDKDGFFVADAEDYKIKKFNFDRRLLLSFGTEGGGKSQFRTLSGISIDQNGNVFAVDAKKNTIQRFSAEKPSGIFPEPAPPLDSVKWIRDINVSASDMVWSDDILYVTNKKEDAVFFIQGGMVKKVVKGQGNERFNDPQGITVDSEGYIWVVDSGNDRVLKFNKEGNIVSILGSSGSTEASFSSPNGICITRGGIVYVADSGNERIQVFNTSGVYMSKIEKISYEELKRPVDVAVDASDNVYVVDEKWNRVFKFNPAGTLVMAIGHEGEYDGEFKEPKNIVVTKDEIFILDSANTRVQVFDYKGKFLRKFGARGKGKGDFIEPVSLALKDETTIFISDPVNERIQELGIIYTPLTILNPKAEPAVREINLNWPKNQESFISHYNIYRSEDKVNYKLITSSKDISFRDGNVNPGITYFYRVSAVAKNGNEGGKSSHVEAVAKKLVASPPTDINAFPGQNEISLNWKIAREGDISAYVIYKEADGAFKEIARSKADSFIDRGLKPNTTYIYKVTAISTDGEEGRGTTIKATTIQKKTAMLTDIKASPEENEILLSWATDKEGDIASYIIYREVDGVFKEIGRSNTGSFIDRGLKPNMTYAYKVTAVSAAGEEGQSAIVRATTIRKKPPIDLAVLKMRDIFPNAYKIYEKEGIGRIRLSNNLSRTLSDIRVFFNVKEFMNAPAEVEITELSPEKPIEIDLKPVFNNKILRLKENTSVQAELKIIYSMDNEIKSLSVPHDLMVIITDRKYTAADEKRFKTALHALDETAAKKPEKEVVKKIRERLRTEESLIKRLVAKGLGYGEAVTCIYLLRDGGRYLNDVLDLRDGGQSWADIISTYDISLADVTDILKEVEQAISKKPQPKKKERSRESEKYLK
ncbi:MAG: 6-bladed beta-propeller [Nitrospirae bacterium]|nr:6-bladed beta-propeller [Nitrospirota bacterium]